MSHTRSEQLRVVVICGLNGAGKTSASDTLEDQGYFCVDNLPVSLVAPLVDFSLAAGGKQRHLGLVATVQTPEESDSLLEVVAQLRVAGHRVDLLFLDADEAALVRRFSETRRRHPMDRADADLKGAIAAERALLGHLAASATHSLDTSALSARELRQQVAERFPLDTPQQQVVRVESFGFKHGVPRDANLVLDVRFLPNPYFVEGLREQTGDDEPVANFVLGQAEAQRLLEHVDGALQEMLPAYLDSGVGFLKIAIGCTGGHHRSVALANEVARRLLARGTSAHARHRDIAR